MCQIHGEDKRKVTFIMDKNETEIDFELIKKGTPTVYTKCEGNPWRILT